MANNNPIDGRTTKVMTLNKDNPDDLAFCREAFGYDAEIKGWFREYNRIFMFKGSLPDAEVPRILSEPPPPSILETGEPPLPDGPASQHLITMPDGLRMTWIRHPSALPGPCRPHWRGHTHMFVLENPRLGFTAYTSIHSYAHVEGADAKFRFFGPGGIRWIDYPDRIAAINDALDMSLAVAMKIQVVGTPCAGNKIAVYGDYSKVGPALKSIFTAYERMGIIVTSADLGLSIEQLRQYALPVAPTSLVPLGVYRNGVPSSLVTSRAAFGGIQAMAESLAGEPKLGDLTLSLQGIGEVGFHLAGLILETGARLVITEASGEIRRKFREEHRAAFEKGQAAFLDDLDGIYDAAADLFIPCALRDILTDETLKRFKAAGVRMIGGPANNLFPDQVRGPWAYHEAGLPVVPYEGIGAGGVTGVAFSVMTGIFGECPFTLEDKIARIREYVRRIMTWSKKYDLPAQVVSDRVLFNRVMRRRVMQQAQSDALLTEMKQVFDSENSVLEDAWVNDATKRGFFQGAGRFPDGGWALA